jgi:hypothetical protein
MWLLILATAALVLGVFSLIKGRWGSWAKPFTTWLFGYPIGPIAFIALGIIFGGIGGVMMGFSSIGNTISGQTASVVSDRQLPAVQGSLSCEFSTVTGINVSGGAITTRADQTNIQRYYADVPSNAGADSINGTLLCKSTRPNIRDGVYSDCYIKAGSFRNEVSTTDSNTYYILATSAAPSKVPGFPWQQTAYIADSGTTNTPATTSSAKERTDLIFAQDETLQYLGFHLTLPGATTFGYLNNQTSIPVEIVCDGATQGTLVVTKVAA